jgi:VWFA-related protein
MRTLSLIVLALFALPGLVLAQADYRVSRVKLVSSTIEKRNGKDERLVRLKFTVERTRKRVAGAKEAAQKVVIEEDGVKVHEVPLAEVKERPVTAVLAMDISGSMARRNKMEEAKRAALTFIDKLGEDSDVGLVLFDHEIKLAIEPAKGSVPQDQHRENLRQKIREAKPQGGTAYLDATIKAVQMLKGVPGHKVVVVMTDGVDTNSKATLQEAIDAAIAGELSVYTVGIGKPGENKQVTTVLVLDHSGSMIDPADAGDTKRKIDALKDAAKRFVGLMRKGSQTTLLPFSTVVGKAGAFISDVDQLKARIDELKPRGGTALYDAAFVGIEKLVAQGPPGKKAVVVLTDGRDESPGSRHQPEEVISRAREAKVPLYMLGLGRKHEINEEVMQKMAKETGGSYYHAGNAKKLLDVFEGLSIELSDDGIDEASLKKLAGDTGGTYSHVGDLDKLEKLSTLFAGLAEQVQWGSRDFDETFTSRRPKHDGTLRDYDVKVVGGSGTGGPGVRASDVVRGLIVPQMGYWVYLAFLGGLVVLLVIPSQLYRLSRAGGGKGS